MTQEPPGAGFQGKSGWRTSTYVRESRTQSVQETYVEEKEKGSAELFFIEWLRV